MKVKTIIIFILSFIAIVIVARFVGRFFGIWAGQRAIAERIIDESKKIEIPKSFEEALESEDPVFKLAATCTPAEIKENIDITKINNTNTAGYTPLMFAAMFNPNPDAINVLVELGADKNARSNTTEDTFIAASRWNKSTEVIQRLIDLGFNVNGRTIENGKTALMYAANYNENPDVLRVLIENGANVNLKSLGGLYEGDTALAFSCRFFALGNVEKCKILLEAGCNINERNAFGQTPLIIAIKSELFNEDIIKLLLQNGADASIKDNEGKTALDYAELDSTKQIFRESGI